MKAVKRHTRFQDDVVMSTDSVPESSSSGTPSPPLSKLATVHFKPEDFTRPFHSNLKRALREDEFGVCIWPTVHAGKRAGENEHQGSPTKRQKRMASNLLLDLLLLPWFRLVLYQIISNIFFLYRMSDQPKKGLPIWIRHAQPLRESHRLIRTPLLM